MTTSVANLVKTQYVKINSRRESITLQSLRDTVRIALSDVKPALANTVYHTLGGGDDPLQLTNIDTDVWALSVSDNSLLVFTETEDVGRPKDYFVEVAEGNVPGASLLAVIGKNSEVFTSPEDLWGAGGVMTYPVAPESWEIVSDSANDTAAGTGAQTVVIESLDADYNTQIQTVSMNGLTPVAIPGTHIRPRSVTVTAAGSYETNEGNIVARVAGAGAIRNYVAADAGASNDGRYTVPAGKKAYILNTYTLYAKNDSGNAWIRVRPENGAWIRLADIPLYQNVVNFNVKALLSFGAKTDLVIQSISDIGSTANVTSIVELLLIDEVV